DQLQLDSEVETREAWDRVMETTGVSPWKLAAAVARHFQLDVANLEAAAPQAHHLVPGSLARRLGVLPLGYSDRSLNVATADPVSLRTERELGLISDRTIGYAVAPPKEIRRAVEETYGSEEEVPYEIPELDELGVSRILVVEDDPEMRALLASVLAEGPFDVVAAEDGETALERLEEGGIDLVTLDLNLPGMKGIEVLETIRRRPRSRRLPVIVATGYGDPEVEVLLFQAGADDFVVKPVDPKRFLLRVEAVLRRRGLGDADE
ncbi:MAG: response regulator, partial [Longimicrobiales bacterium]|nr:response regulator [Longimicrobiales bacterium]